MPTELSRRGFLIAGAGAAAAALTGAGVPFGRSRRRIPGAIVGASSAAGHRLREGGFPAPVSELEADCVIVGGGMAGLSAAWRLRRRGFERFILLELENETGGNSRSGANAVSPYPWGAHYVPIPSDESVHVRELFEELGVITGYSPGGLPVYHEPYLCSDPQERLLVGGRWQEGLVPKLGVGEAELEQYRAFFAEMERYRALIGSDGKRAFTIPLELGSRDPALLALDAIPMSVWLRQRGWDSPHLRWYLDYCYRDDFGTALGQVSAWAGIHYFASRSGRAANAPAQSVLTWPEGNGWIASRLRAGNESRIRTGALAFSVGAGTGGRQRVDFLELGTGRATRIHAGAVILAAPRFVASRLLGEAPVEGFSYAPWMVANVTVSQLPEGTGAPLSWDNVPMSGDSLGYVVATHQRIERYPTSETVLTYYLPLSGLEPVEARKRAIGLKFDDWSDIIVRDLAKMHPGIEDTIARIDVWLWGHGMIRPTPGFIWGGARQEASRPRGGVFFAHSDLSGLSLFEEAQYWGVRAADDALRFLGKLS